MTTLRSFGLNERNLKNVSYYLSYIFLSISYIVSKTFCKPSNHHCTASPTKCSKRCIYPVDQVLGARPFKTCQSSSFFSGSRTAQDPSFTLSPPFFSSASEVIGAYSVTWNIKFSFFIDWMFCQMQRPN